jgi:ferredoxin
VVSDVNGKLNVVVAHHKCTSAGQCLLSAPNVFDQSEENGTIVLLDAHPPESERGRVLDAIHRCPASVISLAETDPDEEA